MNFFPDMMLPFGDESNSISSKSKTRPKNFVTKKRKKRLITKESRKRNRTNGKKLLRK